MFNEEQGYKKGPDTKSIRQEPREIQPRSLQAADVNAGYDAAFAQSPEGEPGEAQQVFDRTTSVLAEGFRQRTTPIGEDEIATTINGLDQDTGTSLPVEAQWSATENPFAGTTINPDSAEVQALNFMEGMKQELQTALTEVGQALAKGDTDSATKIARSVLERCEGAGVKALPAEMQTWYQDIKSNLQKVLDTDDPAAKRRLYRFACGAADFLPVVGPAKMLAEAVHGQTLGGDQLNGWQRFLHGAEGLTFLTIDLTGFGAVATKLAKAGKGGLMSAKLLTRTGALMRVLKVPRQVYTPVYRSGAFLLRHPRLAQLATRGIEGMAKGRKVRLAQELPRSLQADTAADTIANPTQRDGMELTTPPDYELQQTAA